MKKRLNRIWRAALFLPFVLLLAGICCSCQETGKEEEKKDLAYTVVPEKELSKELVKLIDKKKENAFRLSYLDGDALYIVEGFGTKESAGYSVLVDQLYVMGHAIYFNSLLEGPKEDVTFEKTYPYIVVKVERREEPVVFL